MTGGEIFHNSGSKDILKELACIVVFYNPDSKAAANITEYQKLFPYIVVVDNSDKDNSGLLPAGENIEYIFNGENFGIAKALNIGANAADNKSCKYILTLDQDSFLPESSLKLLLKTVVERSGEKWGIISAFQNDGNYALENLKGVRELPAVITSGNILSMAAYKDAGPFEEKLFIDCVDFEYSFRLRKLGYKIFQNCGAELQHTLGTMETRVLFGRKFSVTHHAPIRYYYKTRNGLYVARKYKKEFPEYRKQVINTIIADVFKIILFEKKKLKKLGSIARGIWDGMP
ncbi:MAG TPA: glycosyltransferase family 2 protein [Ignavibacteriales bacterium]|nr:glycosyltransferase family 2 protein [Ignavibacteriales bacterium]